MAPQQEQTRPVEVLERAGHLDPGLRAPVVEVRRVEGTGHPPCSSTSARRGTTRSSTGSSTHLPRSPPTPCSSSGFAGSGPAAAGARKAPRRLGERAGLIRPFEPDGRCLPACRSIVACRWSLPLVGRRPGTPSLHARTADHSIRGRPSVRLSTAALAAVGHSAPGEALLEVNARLGEEQRDLLDVPWSQHHALGTRSCRGISSWVMARRHTPRP